MLRGRLYKISDANTKLHETTGKIIQIEMMMAKVAEVDLIEFERDCNLKLFEDTENKFLRFSWSLEML